MANTVSTRVLLDGKKDAYIWVYLKSDGASGELVNQVVVDPATLAPIDFDQKATKLTIIEVWYELGGFSTLLKFNATTPVPAWKLMPAASSNYIGFNSFKGIKDNSGTGSDGKITIDTSDFTTATDEGTFILHVMKDA